VQHQPSCPLRPPAPPWAPPLRCSAAPFHAMHLSPQRLRRHRPPPWPRPRPRHHARLPPACPSPCAFYHAAPSPKTPSALRAPAPPPASAPPRPSRPVPPRRCLDSARASLADPTLLLCPLAVRRPSSTIPPHAGRLPWLSSARASRPVHRALNACATTLDSLLSPVYYYYAYNDAYLPHPSTSSQVSSVPISSMLSRCSEPVQGLAVLLFWY
jgi:hypothetical protein